MLTATCSPVIKQNESRCAAALSPGLILVGALVVELGVRAQLGTASVVNRTWCQLWRVKQRGWRIDKFRGNYRFKGHYRMREMILSIYQSTNDHWEY